MTDTPITDTAMAVLREDIAQWLRERTAPNTERMGRALDALTVTDTARAVARGALDAARERATERTPRAVVSRGELSDPEYRDAVTVEGMHRLTRAAVALTYRAGASVAQAYDVDPATLTARTLDALAAWIGALDADTAREILDGEKYRGTVWRIARQRAGRMGSGRGTMPRLSHGAHSPLCIEGECVTGCPVDTVRTALDAATVTVGQCDGGRMVARGARRLTDTERDALARTLTFERTERAPAYARMLDGFGDGAPAHGTPHPMGHRAPSVPHRDAPSVRRASMLDAARAVAGSDGAHLLGAVLDALTDTTRGGVRVDWRMVSDALDGVTVRTCQNRTRALLDALDGIDRDTVDTARERESARLLGDTVTPHPVTRHDCTATGCEHGRAVVSRGTAPERHTVALDAAGAGVPSDPILDAWTAALDAVTRCDHAAGSCPAECPERIARRARLARLDALAAAHGIE